MGQGKWYPGEPLPRWKLSCIWRKDGVSIWNNPELFADVSKHYSYEAEAGARFLHLLTGKIVLDPKRIIPAYEDPFYFVWEEGKLPVNFDPLSGDLSQSLERQKLLEVLQHGMNRPVAYVLPLKWSEQDHCWQSCTWAFRRKHLFLVPGNSPAGLRLPLDSIREDDKILSSSRIESRGSLNPAGEFPGTRNKCFLRNAQVQLCQQ